MSWARGTSGAADAGRGRDRTSPRGGLPRGQADTAAAPPHEGQQPQLGAPSPITQMPPLRGGPGPAGGRGLTRRTAAATDDVHVCGYRTGTGERILLPFSTTTTLPGGFSLLPDNHAAPLPEPTAAGCQPREDPWEDPPAPSLTVGTKYQELCSKQGSIKVGKQVDAASLRLPVAFETDSELELE